MTSDSSSIREGLVWAREANGCVSHTCSVPFTAWTRENVSVREEASSIRKKSAPIYTIGSGPKALCAGARSRFVPDGRHCSDMFMPLAGHYQCTMVDFHVYRTHAH